MRRLIFDKLLLVSERERSARSILLSSGKTMLTGGNSTGKSRVTKHLFWALGAESHKRDAGNWDSNTIAVLFFSIDDKQYISLRRQHDRFAILDEAGNFLVATGKYSEHQRVMTELLGYRLTLGRQGQFRGANISYLALPYFLDQDGGWETSWAAFDSLRQFENWLTPTFELFTGIRTNAYLVAQAQRNALRLQRKKIDEDLEIQRGAFDKVSAALESDALTVSPLQFRSELRQLAHSARATQERQRDLRMKVAQSAIEIARFEGDLRLARSAQQDTVADLVYLTDLPEDEPLVCPTCGTQHQTPFHAQLRLGSDADMLDELAGGIAKKLEMARAKNAKLAGELAQIDANLRELSLEQDKGGRAGELHQLMASYSRKTVTDALDVIVEKFRAEAVPIDGEIERQTAIMRQFEDTKRRKDIKRDYLDFVERFMGELNVPVNQLYRTKIGSRPNVSGSEGRRAVLAMHLALLRTAEKHSDVVMLPFVVDTPQQSGQDDVNLPAMINAVYKFAIPGQQTIVASESPLPAGVDLTDVETRKFADTRQLLLRDEYNAIATLVKPWLQEAERASLAEIAGTRPSDE